MSTYWGKGGRGGRRDFGFWENLQKSSLKKVGKFERNWVRMRVKKSETFFSTTFTSCPCPCPSYGKSCLSLHSRALSSSKKKSCLSLPPLHSIAPTMVSAVCPSTSSTSASCPAPSTQHPAPSTQHSSPPGSVCHLPCAGARY